MEISQWLIAELYVYAILLGMMLGAVYDGLRISRVFLGARYSRRMADRLRGKKLPLLSPPKERRESPFLGTVIFFEDLFFAIFGSVAFILMQYAANLGVTYATLEVRRSNERAQNLYKALGFQYVGVRKRYYEDNGEDAFIFCCIAMPKPEEDFEFTFLGVTGFAFSDELSNTCEPLNFLEFLYSC